MLDYPARAKLMAEIDQMTYRQLYMEVRKLHTKYQPIADYLTKVYNYQTAKNKGATTNQLRRLR
jgi:hypothetical protein